MDLSMVLSSIFIFMMCKNMPNIGYAPESLIRKILFLHSEGYALFFISGYFVI